MQFVNACVQCIESLLEKFKEKKPTLIQVLKEAVDACYMTVSIYLTLQN